MNKKLVVAINGVGGTGKDTFCDYCTEISRDLDIGVTSISSMDQIKEIAQDLGWEGGKTSKDRKFLSDLKDLSTEYNDGPFRYIKSRILKMKHDIMFIHIRETAEIEKTRVFVESRREEHGYKFMSVRVNRNVSTETNNTGDMGATLPYDYSLEIDNNGSLNGLFVSASNFMSAAKSTHLKN